MTSKLTRERLLEIAEDGFLKHGESKELASMALAAMDSEPVAVVPEDVRQALSKMDDEIIAELDAEESACRAAMAGEPVAWTWNYREQWHVTNDERRAEFVAKDGDVAVLPLYRHAQPAPVVPQDVLEALQKVARIRLDLNDFDGDRRGIADCLCDAEETLIEVVNRRAAMLAAAPQSPGSEPATVPGKWIPVSERMPDENAEQHVLACFKGGDISTLYYFEGRWDDAYGIVPICQDVTHWMPLPAAPQEVKK